MGNIEKRHIIDSNKLNGEFYFASILQEAYGRGLLSDSDIENIQMQCIKLLAYKTERYNSGDSSSIRVETAESIMKSNLYTIGLYLKSLPDPDVAAEELKGARIHEMYEKGRKLINAKFNTAKHIYKLVEKNKLATLNYTYNATLDEKGIGLFFKLYNPDYEAHECPSSIDYQLCSPAFDLAGVEFIQKYLENIYLENQFCWNFDMENIHHLLYGYDKGYKDLLINIFEQVLTGALGCSLANRSIVELNISEKDIKCLYNELSKHDSNTLALKLGVAAKRIFEELNITNPSLQKYVEKGLQKIAPGIANGVNTRTLDKVFVSPVNPEAFPKIHFISQSKMDDDEYRKLIDELLICRYSSDKLSLIREKVKSFGDLEDILFDGELTEEEIFSVFNTLKDVEIAAMVKRHPFNSGIEAVDLSEEEQTLRLYLKTYIGQLAADRQKQIFDMANQLAAI